MVVTGKRGLGVPPYTGLYMDILTPYQTPNVGSHRMETMPDNKLHQSRVGATVAVFDRQVSAGSAGMNWSYSVRRERKKKNPEHEFRCYNNITSFWQLLFDSSTHFLVTICICSMHLPSHVVWTGLIMAVISESDSPRARATWVCGVMAQRQQHGECLHRVQERQAYFWGDQEAVWATPPGGERLL